MDHRSLASAASSIPSMAEHVDFLTDVASPCVDIVVAGPPASPASSRFGGLPLVPKAFEWPSHDIGGYRFLGQINFTEIAEPPELLPAKGLLSLFYAHDDDGEVFWRDDGYILGFYEESFANHVLLEPPTNVAEARQIELIGGIDVPRHVELRADWPFDGDDLWNLVDALERPREYLLGYPTFTSLAYDPTPGPEWTSLLTVGSLDEFGWNWHDGDMLMVFIEVDRLIDHDFSHLKSDAG